MKPNKIKTFITLWLVHIYIYITLYVLGSNLYNGKWELKNDLAIILMAPASILIIGGIPFFIIINILIMIFLLKMKYSSNWFKGYYMSVIITNIFMFTFIYSHDTLELPFITRLDKNNLEVDIFLMMIPSLVITVIVNRFLFKKKFENIHNTANNS